jgi:hypothetical protein
MSESSAHQERRQHPRLPVTSGIIAVLISSSPEIIGSVSDISLGGVKITYHKPTESELDCTKLKVDLISDDRYVEAIPCSNAWDQAVEDSSFLAAGELRQCGIHFTQLNPNQLFLLRSFINRCAAKAPTSSSQSEIQSPSAQ